MHIICEGLLRDGTEPELVHTANRILDVHVSALSSSMGLAQLRILSFLLQISKGKLYFKVNSKRTGWCRIYTYTPTS